MIASKKKKKSLKCPYYGLWKFIFWFWESPTTGWHACKVKKNTFIVLKYAFIFFLFCSPLPNGSFNDSFFQTPPLRDANLRWLVWWPSLLWLVFCVQHMSITERPSPLRPQLLGKHPNSHGICVSPMQKRIDKALQFVHQHIALFFIRTTKNNNDKHSLFINTFLDNCERADIAVSRRPTSCAERTQHTQLNTYFACYSTEYMTATVFKRINC